jgi:Tfp pilus assembly protein PilO
MKRSTIVAVGVTLAIALAWYGLLWSPKAGELASLRDRKAAAQEQASSLQVKLAALRRDRAEIPALRARLATLQQAVPDEPDLAGFLVMLSDTAARSGVSLRHVAPAAPTAPTVAGAPTSVGVALDVEGSFLPVWTFVRNLLALPRTVVLDGVQVTAGGDPEALQVALTGRIFTTQAVAAK